MVLDKKKLVLAYMDWPLCDLGCRNILRLNIIIINAAQNPSQRNRFNDPSDPVEVLIMSIRIVTSLTNFQGIYDHIIFLDLKYEREHHDRHVSRIVQR